MNYYFIFKCRYCGQVKFVPCAAQKYENQKKLVDGVLSIRVGMLSAILHECNETDIGIMEIVGYKKTDFILHKNPDSEEEKL